MNNKKSNSTGRFGSARLRNQTAPTSFNDIETKIKTKLNVMNPVTINPRKLMTNLENFAETPKTTLVVIPLEQLAEMMANVVQIELKKHQAQHPQTAPEDEFLNATETIAFLRVSRPTYQKLRQNGRLPAVMASDKRLLFKKSDLIAYLNSRHESNN